MDAKKHFLMLPFLWIGMIVFQQDSLIYHPRQYTKELRTNALEPEFDMESLRFETADGNQHVLLLRRPNSKVRRLYLVFGGNAMLARDWLGVLYRVRHDLAEDVAFALVDYPGFGESAGAQSVASIVRTGKHALFEARDAIDRALEEGEEEVPPRLDWVGILGHSIGCAAAMELAAAVSLGGLGGGGGVSVRHLALSAPFTSLPEMAKVMLPVLRPVPAPLIRALTPRHRWDNVAAAERLRGGGASGPAAAAPPPRVDIIHGTADAIVPHEQGLRLWARLEELGFPGAFRSVAYDHNDLLGTREYGDWLRSALRDAR